MKNLLISVDTDKLNNFEAEMRNLERRYCSEMVITQTDALYYPLLARIVFTLVDIMRRK